MLKLGTYYTINMLAAAKWPRKSGIRNKPVYDVLILDTVVNQLVDWAAAVGAGSPFLAELVLNAYCVNDDYWDVTAKHVSNIIESLSQKRNVLDERDDPIAPHDIIQPYRFAEHYKSKVPADRLSKTEVMGRLESILISSIVLGYCEPDYVTNWYEHNLLEHKKELRKYRKIGVEVGELMSLDDWLQNAQDVVKLYREEEGDDFGETSGKFIKYLRSNRQSQSQAK